MGQNYRQKQYAREQQARRTSTLRLVGGYLSWALAFLAGAALTAGANLRDQESWALGLAAIVVAVVVGRLALSGSGIPRG